MGKITKLPGVHVVERNDTASEMRIGRPAVKSRIDELLQKNCGKNLDPFERPGVDCLAIVIGAMKAGSTTLFSYLRQHPEIAPNQLTKEPAFFCSSSTKDNFAFGIPWYKAQFEFDPRRHKYGLEASVAYSRYPQFTKTFRRMKDCPFTYKFLYVLRDPVDRVESHIKHQIARGRLDPSSYDIMSPNILRPSMYASQLDRLRKYFSVEDVLMLSFKELQHEPFRLLEKVHRFLGIRDHEYGETRKENTRKVFVRGREWLLTSDERQQVADMLVEDSRRLEKEYGFDAQGSFDTLFSYASPTIPISRSGIV